MHKLIIGCGYLGHRVARQWQQAGDHVSVLTRSAQRADQLAREGLHPLVGDLTDANSLPEFPACDTILYAVGYDRSSGASIQQVYVEGLKHCLDALPATSGRIIYISSTGVYGQDDGNWVDESSPCHPTRPGGVACLDAETLLKSHPRGVGSLVLRLAGIYGPNRLPRRAAIEAGESLATPADGYLNLVHVEDGVQAILAAESREHLPSLLLVSDGQPVLRGAYFEEMARLLDAPSPVFEPPDPASPAAQRATGNKRISNQRLLKELEISLKYPSFQEGLGSLLADPDTTG
ncbi:MAG: SDR family oxidoreductase [Planctomycetota bacterium]|nr:SDR family oxidoreductase [Planctomycetota bacterium]